MTLKRGIRKGPYPYNDPLDGRTRWSCVPCQAMGLAVGFSEARLDSELATYQMEFWIIKSAHQRQWGGQGRPSKQLPPPTAACLTHSLSLPQAG